MADGEGMIQPAPPQVSADCLVANMGVGSRTMPFSRPWPLSLASMPLTVCRQQEDGLQLLMMFLCPRMSARMLASASSGDKQADPQQCLLVTHPAPFPPSIQAGKLQVPCRQQAGRPATARQCPPACCAAALRLCVREAVNDTAPLRMQAASRPTCSCALSPPAP